MSRAFQFTWFYEEAKEHVAALIESRLPKEVIYVQGGFESCPTTNKPHVQGQFIVDQPINMNKAKVLILAMTGVRCHLEKVKNLGAMTNYNKKDGDVFTIGDYPSMSAETEFDEAAALVLMGKTKEVKKSLLIRYPTGIASLEKIFYKPASDLDIPPGCKVGIWIHGSPESFKSLTARRLFGDKPTYDKSLDALWDYYCKEEIVVIDDVTKSHMTWMYEKLLRWADRYAFPAKMLYKGSPVIRPRYIIVTSNWSLEDMFPVGYNQDISIKYRALRRRFADYNADTRQWSHLRSEVREIPLIPEVPQEFFGTSV